MKRKNSGSNGQYYVTVRKKKEWSLVLDDLDAKGYENYHNLSKRKRPKRPPVLVVDINRKQYFLTNVTCLACSATCGHYAISFDTFQTLLNE